jgi:hypothetical protein
MARQAPNRPEPDGLPAASQYMNTITRPDRSTMAPDNPTAVPPPTLDAVGPASSSSPLGSPRSRS